ncbi:hypothetical protein BDZ94DRAFT_1269841 [Collybia nuda]|uniref:Uncharacterized protein n=1 Tax=Collybia nuda TaxID=64659 RepID=A0A9P5XXB9_9AGAR|nr:hypothetical protein BDZ94DRAFT_1269841 [Collybia nuda]
MAPPNHTTPEQCEWLISLLPKFLEHQQEKNILDFWSMLDHTWFTRWPEPGVTEAELQPMEHPSQKIAAEGLKKQNSYLRNWFNNSPVHIQPQPKTEKVKPMVSAEILGKDMPKKEHLGVVKMLTCAAFDAEPMEVRDAFYAQASLLKAENAARSSIESVAYVLDSFICDLAVRTGWSFSVMGGGPDPVNGGRIQTISFHEGQNCLGASFKKAHVSFDESVLKPYIEFINQVYPPETCSAHTLPSKKLNGQLYAFEDGAAENHINDSSMETEVNGFGAQKMSQAGSLEGTGDAPALESVQGIPQGIMDTTERPAHSMDKNDMSHIDPVLRPPHHPSNILDNISVTVEHTPQTVVESTVPPNINVPIISPLPAGSPPSSPSASNPTTPISPPLPNLPPSPPRIVTLNPFPPLPLDIPPAGSLPGLSTASLLSPPSPLNTPQTPPLPSPPTPPETRASAKGLGLRKRPGVLSPSKLQKVVERALLDENTMVADNSEAWSAEVIKAVKSADHKAEKKAKKIVKTVTKASLAKTTKRNVVVATSVTPALLDSGRPQRTRKVAASKEVVPLTAIDNEEVENTRPTKKCQVQ